MDNIEDTENLTDLNPKTMTSSAITIKSTNVKQVCGDDFPLKNDTEAINKEMCDVCVEKNDGDIPVSDNTAQLLLSTDSVQNSESNHPNESSTVCLHVKEENRDVLEASKEAEVLEQTAIEHVDSVVVNSRNDASVYPQQSSSPTDNNSCDVVADVSVVVNKTRDREALRVVITNDEYASKNIIDSHQPRISGKTVEKSKHTTARKLKRVMDGDGNTRRNIKVAASHSANRSTECDKSIFDSDFNFADSFGESHVNKLMSFVDSLEKIDPPLTKACGMSQFSHLGSTSHTKELNNLAPVKIRQPGDDLFKPYTISPSNVTNRNTSSIYVTKSGGLTEQPLDLSLTRHRSPGNDFQTKPTRGSPSFSKGFASTSITDHIKSEFGDKPSTFGSGSNLRELSQTVKRPWVPDSGSTSSGINWSLAASSLASLQAQMEAVILSYPLFKASIELCKNLIPPGDTENGHVESTSKINIKSELQDNKAEYISPYKRKTDRKENSPELKSPKYNLNELNTKASLYSSSTTSKSNHSPHMSRKKQKFSLPSDKYSKASMDWRSNQSSLKGKSLTMPEDSIKKSRMDDCSSDNPKVPSLVIGSDVIDDKRLLTSLSCSCQRQFATLYQLTIHLEETGHHPSQVKTDSADDFAKLVRGQDLWLSAGHAQAEQTLRCMHCHASFHSLPELTVHMVKTKHYVDIVGREDSEASRQLISKEVLQKIQQTLNEQECDNAKSSKEPHVCKQCRMEFRSEDDLSDHLFETGHQMLAEEIVQAALSDRISSDCQEDCKSVICDVKDSRLIESQSETPLRQNCISELNTQTESIICASIKREKVPNCAESSTANEDYKPLTDRDEKQQFEMKFDPNNVSSKKGSDMPNKRNDFSLKVSEHERSISNGKRKKESSIQQSSISIYKRKPAASRIRKSPDFSQSRHDKVAKLPQESTSPFRNVESRSWNENNMCQSDLNKTEGDVSRKGFMELISPLVDNGDSSSTLKAMESFVERSFSSSSLISPVSHYSVTQAGKHSSLNSTSYSNAVRSATSSASKYHAGINWNDRSSAITQNRVYLTNSKNPTVGSDSSSDSCHSPPLELNSKEKLENSVRNSRSEFPITNSRKDTTKRKRKDSSCDFESSNLRFNSSLTVNKQPNEYHSKESAELIKSSLNIETSDNSYKVKAESHGSHETVSPTNVTSSYTSSTLDYLQHFVDDRNLQLIPPQIGTAKTLQDAGRKLSIKT